MVTILEAASFCDRRRCAIAIGARLMFRPVEDNMKVAIKMEREEADLDRDFEHFRLELVKVKQLRDMLHGDDADERLHTVSASSSDLQEGHLEGGAYPRGGSSPARLARDHGHKWTGESPPSAGQIDDIFKGNLFILITRHIITFIGISLNLDLFAKSAQSDGATGNRPQWHWIQLSLFDGFVRLKLIAYRHIERSHWHRRANWRFWPRFLQLACLTCVFHLSCNMYYQYSHDYSLFKLKRLRWLNKTHPHKMPANHLEHERQLLERVQQTGDRLHFIGAPLMHLSFAIQGSYMLISGMAVLCYVGGQLYFKYRSPYNFYFIRNFLDFASEQRNCERLVCNQVRKFIESSHNYTQALVDFSERSLGERLFFEPRADKLGRRLVGQPLAGPADECQLTDQLHNSANLEVAAQAESLSCKQLRQMLAADELRPMNQAVGWLRRRSRFYGYLLIFSFFYSLLFNISLLYVTFLMRPPWVHLHTSDLIVGLESVFLIIICNLLACFHTTTCAFACRDQSCLATRLRSFITLIISLNSLRFYKNLRIKMRANHQRRSYKRNLIKMCQLEAAGRPPLPFQFDPADEQGVSWLKSSHLHSSYKNKMNKDLLLALTHYKIFVAQISELKRALEVIAFASLIIMVLFPIVGRLHMPYFDESLDTRIRLSVAAMSCAIIVPVNINLIPICYLHQRCMSLYEQLSNLLAHATEITSNPEGRDVYDRHIISALRKELSHPDRMAAQFAIRINGINFDYPTLVKLHFYYGVIVLSIIAKNRASQQQEVVGTLFEDPFGLL